MATDETAYSGAQLRALTQAGVALASEFSLLTVLQKLVDIAREQVNARYGALSVMSPQGEIQQFLTSGVSEEERQRIGGLPQGRGLLGVLREGSSLRLADMTKHPRFEGLSPNHPQMRSLLGVPVVLGGRVIGNLYLADKQSAAAFDERDEEIVRLLAAQAAVAVRNAQMYEAEQQRAEEWKALFELGQQVSASPDLQELLDSIVARARRLLQTDMAALMLLSGPDTLVMAAHDGLRTQGMRKLRLLSEHGLQGLTLSEMRPVIVEDYQADPRLKNRPAGLVAEEGLVSQICVPLKGKRGPLGTLTVGDRARRAFSERQAALLEAFANWTAVAIETSQLYDRLASLARLEERERIGMDLHDGVIQAIYAVGLRLEDVADRLADSNGDARAALDKTMDDLNKVIKDIRSYIFDLRPSMSQVADLPQAIRQLAKDLRLNTLMDVQVEVAEPLTGLLDEAEALAFFHIAQEALNNISKHSRASRVQVRLLADERQVRLEVEDNGVGFQSAPGAAREGQGLRNMHDRARSVGATLSWESEPGKGTSVRALLPVTAGRDVAHG
ncbi:MAG: GAF domain-containing protein [Dehalococcoidia bacterium]|nr:GAF domain-containing protein [Dehalococcoidia bacterium]